MNNGFEVVDFELPKEAREFALAENFTALDFLMGGVVQTRLKVFLQQKCPFQDIEHILALRRGDDPDEEDGIWHDDSSRKLAFSWSLNFWRLPKGGTLGIRKMGDQSSLELGPYPAGKLIIFQTGQSGFEHRTARVIKGRRLVCAGWCS